MFSLPIPEMLPEKNFYRDVKTPFERFSDAGQIENFCQRVPVSPLSARRRSALTVCID
jgi:hypothetical protein